MQTRSTFHAREPQAAELERMLERTLGREASECLREELRRELGLGARRFDELDLVELHDVCEAITDRQLGLPSILARSMALRIRSHRVVRAVSFAWAERR